MPSIFDIIPGLVPSQFSGANAFAQQRYLPGGLSLPGAGNLTPQQTQQYDAFFNEIGRWLSPGQHPTGYGVGPTQASATKWGVDPNVLAKAGWPGMATPAPVTQGAPQAPIPRAAGSQPIPRKPSQAGSRYSTAQNWDARYRR